MQNYCVRIFSINGRVYTTRIFKVVSKLKTTEYMGCFYCYQWDLKHLNIHLKSEINSLFATLPENF